ncbi:hypothetical protein HJA90_10455 [Rhizobium bangladeshense]|nr:hypothetical protein [Rhizobium bangladeshense]
MNEFQGFAEPTKGGNWKAMLRLARDGKAKPLLNKKGRPKVFVDELSATKAVLEHFIAYFNGHLVSSGEIAGGTMRDARRASAERLFRKGCKVIEVRRVRSGMNRD